MMRPAVVPHQLSFDFGPATRPAYMKPATPDASAFPHWRDLHIGKIRLLPGQPVVRNNGGVVFAYLDFIEANHPDEHWTLKMTVKRCGSWIAEYECCFEQIPVGHLCASMPDIYVCLDCVPTPTYRYGGLLK